MFAEGSRHRCHGAWHSYNSENRDLTVNVQGAGAGRKATNPHSHMKSQETMPETQDSRSSHVRLIHSNRGQMPKESAKRLEMGCFWKEGEGVREDFSFS